MDQLEIDHLKERAITLKGGLYDRLEEYHILDFPSKQPHRLIHLLQNILREIDSQIENSKNRDTLLIICQIIMLFGNCLEFIDNAHTQQTPRALVKILENLIGKLSSTSRLLARPLSEYNYTILSLLPILKDKTENLFSPDIQEEIYKQFESDFKIISFPRIERDNILLHAVFGHELGHPIAEEFLKAEEWAESYKKRLERISELVDAEFSDELKNTNNPLDKLYSKSRILDQIIQIRKRALEELISDCVATLIFGPSAMFASYEIFGASDLDRIPVRNNDYYPPSRMRLRVQRDILRENKSLEELRSLHLNWLSVEVHNKFFSFIDHIEKICNKETDKDALRNNRFARIAYEEIDISVNEALKFAKEKTLDCSFKPELIKVEIPELLEKLSFGLPPSEIGIPPNSKICDWRSAILAAWIFKLVGLPLQDSILESKDALDKLHKISLLGIEHIFVRTEYEVFINSKK